MSVVNFLQLYILLLSLLTLLKLFLFLQGAGELTAGASVLSRPAEEFVNDVSMITT